jgi:hypothetical protein
MSSVQEGGRSIGMDLVEKFYGSGWDVSPDDAEPGELPTESSATITDLKPTATKTTTELNQTPPAPPVELTQAQIEEIETEVLTKSGESCTGSWDFLDGDNPYTGV